MRIVKPSNFSLPMLVGLVALTFSGCSSLQLPGFSVSQLPGLSGKKEPNFVGVDRGQMLDSTMNEKAFNSVRQAASQNAIVLHVLGDSDPIRVLPLPETGEPVTVTDLLRQSGATHKLGPVMVSVYRQSPGYPNGLKMQVRMGEDGKTVRPETDYTLRAGDRIQLAKGRAPKPASLVSSMLGLPF